MNFLSEIPLHTLMEEPIAEEEEEEERVVYYDLDEGVDRTLPAPPAASRPKRADPRPPNQRVLAQPTQLFASHTALEVGGEGEDGGEEEEEDDDDDESNPFAALLHANKSAPPPSRPLSPPPHASIRRSPVQHVTPPPPPRPLPEVVSQPRAKRSLSPPQTRPTRVPTKPIATQPLVPTIEAADARPSRWMRTTSTGGTTKRRQSTSSATTLKQQAEAKRRKSLPATMSSLDDRHRPSAPVGRLLSDVLSKATTLLSQERTITPTADHSFEVQEPTREIDDGIADTVNEMRNEQFQTQFFSPSKLRNGASSSSHRRSRADTVLAKIRGGLGDAIRKATRKTNRDLTLLRSQGQTLLGRADQDSASEVHRRDFVIVQLDRIVAHPPATTYDGIVQDLRMANDDEMGQANQPTEGMKLTIAFSASDATQQLHQGSLLKIFAPFHIVNEWSAPGVRRRPRKFLIGTNLFEVVASHP